jgi:hypothetical protein
MNPCSGSLDFSVQIGSPVGEAVFGDTDGDGVDEILVSAADGYLYGLKNSGISAPGYVYDTDPDHGITAQDVDNINTTDKLSGAWASVAGSTSYQVEVVTVDGKPVSTPLWKDVGAATSASLSGLALVDNTRYVFAVRAISPNGPSVDALSNGVTVHLLGDAGADSGADTGVDGGGGSGEGGSEGGLSPDAGTNQGSSGGCACRTSPERGLDLTLAGWLFVPIAAALRRRRRARG